MPDQDTIESLEERWMTCQQEQEGVLNALRAVRQYAAPYSAGEFHELQVKAALMETRLSLHASQAAALHKVNSACFWHYGLRFEAVTSDGGTSCRASASRRRPRPLKGLKSCCNSMCGPQMQRRARLETARSIWASSTARYWLWIRSIRRR